MVLTCRVSTKRVCLPVGVGKCIHATTDYFGLFPFPMALTPLQEPPFAGSVWRPGLELLPPCGEDGKNGSSVNNNGNGKMLLQGLPSTAIRRPEWRAKRLLFSLPVIRMISLPVPVSVAMNHSRRVMRRSNVCSCSKTTRVAGPGFRPGFAVKCVSLPAGGDPAAMRCGERSGPTFP